MTSHTGSALCVVCITYLLEVVHCDGLGDGEVVAIRAVEGALEAEFLAAELIIAGLQKGWRCREPGC